MLTLIFQGAGSSVSTGPVFLADILREQSWIENLRSDQSSMANETSEASDITILYSGASRI